MALLRSISRYTQLHCATQLRYKYFVGLCVAVIFFWRNGEAEGHGLEEKGNREICRRASCIVHDISSNETTQNLGCAIALLEKCTHFYVRTDKVTYSYSIHIPTVS